MRWWLRLWTAHQNRGSVRYDLMTVMLMKPWIGWGVTTLCILNAAFGAIADVGDFGRRCWDKWFVLVAAEAWPHVRGWWALQWDAARACRRTGSLSSAARRVGLLNKTPLFSFNQIVTRKHICYCLLCRFHPRWGRSRPFELASVYAKHFSQAGLLGYQRQRLERWPAGICI